MTTSVVVMDVTSRWGWLNCTPMKIRPAATAATPAARVRVVGVMVMAGSLAVSVVRGGCLGMSGTYGGAPDHRRHHMW